MSEEIKLKKTRECLKCKNVLNCKGSTDATRCINFEPRKEYAEEIKEQKND